MPFARLRHRRWCRRLRRHGGRLTRTKVVTNTSRENSQTAPWHSRVDNASVGDEKRFPIGTGDASEVHSINVWPGTCYFDPVEFPRCMSSPSTLELSVGVACLVLVIGAAWWFVPPLMWQQSSFYTRRNTPDAFTTRRAFNTYASYRSLAASELKSKRKSFNTLRGRYHVLARELGYSKKLDKLASSIDVNSIITDAIADLARVEFPAAVEPPQQTLFGLAIPQDTDLGRVREALKHFVRDWSLEGKEERDKIFKPILDHLSKIPPQDRQVSPFFTSLQLLTPWQNMHVLVPGSGLGRLAWEISELGSCHILFSKTITEALFCIRFSDNRE